MNKRSILALEGTEMTALEPSDVVVRKRVSFEKHQRGSLTLAKPYTTISLASLMTRRTTPQSPLEVFHAAAIRDLERHSNHVRFALPTDENKPEEPEPPAKRRRYQRRCSKTAAMLFPSATLQALEDLVDLSEKPQERRCATDDEWDHHSSLDIAEDLVHELVHHQQELRSKSS